MSFLLRRNRPWTFGDYRDLDAAHSRPNENPIKKPWNQWNDSQTATLTSNVMVFSDATTSTFNFGGYAYEHQPSTSRWGVEFDIDLTVNTSQAAFFGAFVGSSWTRSIQSGDSNLLRIDFFKNSPLLSGGDYSRVRIVTYASAGGLETVLSQTDLPGGINWFNTGGFHNVKVWFDDDKTIRIYVDNVLTNWTMVPNAAYRPSLNARAFNFTNRTQFTAAMKNFATYDRRSDYPSWTSFFYDDFNRANGAPANGWTALSATAQIVGNALSITGTTDGGSGVIRDTGVTTGKQRVEGVLASNPSNTANADSRLFLLSNVGGTQGICARVNGNKIAIVRYSSALTGNPPTFTQLAASVGLSNTVAGDKISLCSSNDHIWVERNNEVVLGAPRVTVPNTNQYAGGGVSRSAFANSASWNDLRILV